LTTNRIKKTLKSFRFRITALIALIIIIITIVITNYFLSETNINENETINIENNNQQPTIYTHQELNKILNTGIDSVLHNFGIKDEWIETIKADSIKKSSKSALKEYVKLFVKNALIPKDLTTLEINADLSNYFNSLFLKTFVKEDIITKDIKIYIYPQDSLNNINKSSDTIIGDNILAIVNINSSDKISRQSAAICIIINNITDYKAEDIDKYFINKNEFSFVFPRNLDEIDLQNKLLHSKKDIIINMTVGKKENYETDFNPLMSDKQIRDKVRSFTIDYPSINTVMLSKIDEELPPQFMSVITDAFSNYRIKVIKSTDLTEIISPSDEKSKEKFKIFSENIQQKGINNKFIITALRAEKKEAEDLYNEIIKLKKLGYKFFNYNEFVKKKEQYEKKEAERLEKLKEEKIQQEKQLKEQKQKEVKKKENKSTDKSKKQTEKKKNDKKKQ
jgi:hypothetical protein